MAAGACFYLAPDAADSDLGIFGDRLGVPVKAGADLDRNRKVAAMRKAPESCQSMQEVRASIDNLDHELVALLAERFRFMGAAARIKQSRSEVRDEPRKQEVIENAARYAATQGLSPEIVEQLFEVLVEASIAYELDRWDKGRAAAR